MPSISVSAENLTRRFGSFVAVDNISFEVNEGEIFGFLGANGAGKTTTIRILCGLLLPSSGHGWVGGFDILTQTEQIKQHIGYMSQKFSLYQDLTLRENIMFYGGVYGLAHNELREKCTETLESMEITEHADRITRDIPLGWKQRLALSCAILHKPKILFLDEPTGGVDPISRREFWHLIYQLAEASTTVFVTTHYMDEAEHCHRLSIMHEGKIVAIGAPAELKEKHGKSSVEEVFIELVKG